MRELSVVIPSFKSEELTMICVRSFVKFCPDNVNLDIVVVENSKETAYKDAVLSISDDITWINNKEAKSGSEANASAIEVGLRHSKHNLVFTAHCDVCVTSGDFYDTIFKKYDEGNVAVGVLSDKHPQRIKALHILGVLSSKELMQKIDMYPKYNNGVQVMDVGDRITKYCRDNNLSYCRLPNTYNDESLEVPCPYDDFGVVRCLSDDGKVVYMHLGRGIAKSKGSYRKKNRVYLKEWVTFCNRLLK
jgi:molybdopterin-guanine dinucleotide biosynthesis protein A